MSSRAAALAARVEEGAASLAEFAAGLSDSEWTSRVKDGRTIGVVVHHVGDVYPIELQLARTIASGQPLVDVTWEAVATMNANHARDHAGVSKEAALAHLREKSREAADAVRTFTDAQLDTAAPFSLSYGAPMTAQFVLEDHAVRHAWHHLARIRLALGR